MPLTMPPRKRDASEPRDMVRVQLRDNDIRSYERSEFDGLKAQYPDAFIVGEQAADEAPAAEQPEAETKATRSAPNKSRTAAEDK